MILIMQILLNYSLLTLGELKPPSFRLYLVPSISKLGSMKHLYIPFFFLLSAGCGSKQPHYETDEVNEICFFGLDKSVTNLTEQFKQTLASGNKSKILVEAESLTNDRCYKTCIRQSDKKLLPRICDAGDLPLTKVALSVKPTDEAVYMGGHLNMYFDGENLKAAELMLIHQK